MKTFSEFLIETEVHATWHPKTAAEVKNIIKEYRGKTRENPHTGKIEKRKFGKSTVNPDLTVDVQGEFKLYDAFLDNKGRVPLKFGKVGIFTVYATGLTTFEGFPNIVYGNNNGHDGIRFIGYQRIVTNLKGFPKSIPGTLNLAKFINPEFTLTGLNNIISSISGYINLPTKYNGPLLSLLYIKDLKGLGLEWSGNSNLAGAVRIINKHLDDGKGHNVLDAQEELISAGLKEFAKL